MPVGRSSKFRKAVTLAGFLYFGGMLAAQTSPVAQAPATAAPTPSRAGADAVSAKAHSILDAGLKMSGLNASDGKPWHMKANYKVFTAGVPSDTGTIEEWWSGPDQWRRNYVTKISNWTEWSVTRAQHFQSQAGFDYLPLDLRVSGPLISPMAQARNFKPEYPMDWKQLNAGIMLDCVLIVNPLRYADGADPDLLFPKLCFDPNSRLRLMGTSDTTVTFNKYQQFQGRAIAYSVEVIVQGKEKSSMDITLLEPLAPADQAMLKPDGNAVAQPFAITAVDPKPVPTYQVSADTPVGAMENRIYDNVVVPVIIKKDGKVKLNGSPRGNGMLTEAAADAIRSWRYEPYLIDGVAVEVSYDVVYKFDGRPFVPETGKPKSPANGDDPKRNP